MEWAFLHIARVGCGGGSEKLADVEKRRFRQFTSIQGWRGWRGIGKRQHNTLAGAAACMYQIFHFSK